MRTRNEQGGELVVTGKDCVHLHLKDKPHRVDVFFKKKNSPPPCDPHHHNHCYDKLEWTIQRDQHHEFTLHIEWAVHDLREIIWLVYY